MYGSLSVIDALADLDLVDEYHLLVHPVYIGGGTPLFRQGRTPVDLDVISSDTFDSGVVLMRCRPR
ncbi:MAG: dihydrofolate reductase family protein [Candidatus Rokuibacteriota bacterium]